MKLYNSRISSMKVIIKIFIVISVTFYSLHAQSIVLVDFGASPSQNIFGLAGWNVVLKSSNQVYSNSGPAGLRVASNYSEYSDFRGIQGSARSFVYGERIAVTWYNNSDNEIRFIPRISFNDPDEPDTGVTGTWFTMRDFTNFRSAMITINPRSTAKSVFNLFSKGVNAAVGNHSLVNINLHIEWGDNQQKQYLICDKIELMSDADTIPPQKPTNLTAQVLSDSRVQLNWDAGVDNVGVVDYFIYLNDQIEGYSRTNSFTVKLLEPSKQYTFSVTALDQIRNESVKSEPITVTTLTFQGRNDLIKPTDFTYLGAFKFSNGWEYGGDALAYNPQGDGGQTGSGAADGFPGSLFSTNIDQSEYSFVGEINIPQPIISPTLNPNELNTAVNLQPFTNIRPNSINNWTDVDSWTPGLVYLSPRGLQTSPKLYHSWGYHFQLSDSKSASLCWCNPTNIGDSNSYAGPWFIGSSVGPPLDPALNDYLFSVPQNWADSVTMGRSLITGRFRQGGLSGLGPTLYAIAPWQSGNPPPIFSELSLTKLLEYGSVNNVTDTTFPNSFIDYNHADDWKGADWLSTNNTSAVMFIGKNALGDNWYGFQGENMHLSWIEWNIPFPDFSQTDPDGKGLRANNYIPMLVLYDPTQLAAVASGTINSFDPQPYAAIRLDTTIFYGSSRRITSASFDSFNKLLYVVEGTALQDGGIIIHVWKIREAQTKVGECSFIPNDIQLFQNYPNPFNSTTTIKYSIPTPPSSSPLVKGRNEVGFVSLKVYDVLGREVETLVNESKEAGIHLVEFSSQKSEISSGVYFYKLKAGNFIETKKMLIIK